MTLSRSPQYRAFSRAVMDEKSLSPLFPVGGGAVVTNDWCITDLETGKQAIAVALNLPDNDEHTITEKVFDEIELDNLKNENEGLDGVY